jgi:hypothetical protein
MVVLFPNGTAQRLRYMPSRLHLHAVSIRQRHICANNALEHDVSAVDDDTTGARGLVLQGSCILDLYTRSTNTQ